MSIKQLLYKILMISDSIKESKIKTIKDLSILDTVWIKDEGIMYEGWIFDITRRCIIVVYGPDLRDFRFRVDKNFDKEVITQNDKSMFCNDPKENCISITN